MFNLVADIERYPEFVPGWREVEVLSRGPDSLHVRQRVSVGPAVWRFRSEARLDPPHTIDIRTIAAPFGDLAIHWAFQSLGDEGCSVAFRADYDSARFVRGLTRPALEKTMASVVDAFEARARELYHETD